MANKKNNNSNPFAMFEFGTHKAVIEALNGAEIEYRKLTMEENDTFQKLLVKGFDDDGKPELDVNKYTDVKYEKVSAGMVSPKMTPAELKALPSEAWI